MINIKKALTGNYKKRYIASIIIAVDVLILGCVLHAPVMGAALAVLFAGAGFLNIRSEQKIIVYSSYMLWEAAVIIVMWFVSLMVMETVHYVKLDLQRYLLNFLAIFTWCELFCLILGRRKAGITVATFLLVLLVTVNVFVFRFRDRELVAADFLSVSTAIEVMDGYEFKIPPFMILGWVLWLMVMYWQFSLPVVKKKRIKCRLVSLVVFVISFVVLLIGSEKIPIKNWINQGTTHNGYYLNFLLGIRDSVIKEPVNYSEKHLDNITSRYEEKSQEEKNKKPNIIVVMSESFADFRVFGKELQTTVPPTPFIDSLYENAIKGFALSSVFGGNTANSEFEFLTGHSMAFLPSGSVAYQQYIKGETYSLAWMLKSLGYRTAATHPYFARGWLRERNYPYLGFDESTFIDSYPAERMVRTFISDSEVYDKILEKLREEDESPLFMMGITMQNHGGYTYKGEDFVKSIELGGFETHYPKAEQYLNLIHETDISTEQFIKAIENHPEDTVVLFFGDHFPKLETKFYEALCDGEIDTLDEQLLQHKVPFFIWANYDIEEEYIECTSLNYLSLHLLDAAGIQYTPYYRFLKEMEFNIPAMNALGFYSKNKNGFIKYSEASKSEEWLLNKYNIMQYNDVFDPVHRNEKFFVQYMR